LAWLIWYAKRLAFFNGQDSKSWSKVFIGTCAGG